MKGALSWPFMRLYLLSVLYFSANAVLNVVIPLKGEAAGAANTTIGIVMGAYLATTMLLRPWAGQVIARHGPIKVLRAILLLNGAALILYTFTGFEGYFVARALQGVCTAFFSMALQLGIIDALPDKERSQGVSMYSLCASLPAVIGPLLAVGIWQAEGAFAIAMIAIAVLTGIVGFSARMEPRETQPPAGGNSRRGADTFRSFGQLVHNPHLFKCSALMLTASMVFGAVTAFMPLYAGQVPGGSAAVYLMLQAGVVVAARFALRKKIPSDGKWHSGYMMGIMLLIAASALCVSLSASAGGAVVLYAGALMMGTAQALLYPTLTTYLTFVLPQETRNVLVGLFIAMADLGVVLGGVLMGPIADLSTYSWMYAACAALGAAMIPLAYERRIKTALESNA